MSSSDKRNVDGMRAVQASAAQLAGQFQLSPETTGAINKLASLSPALNLYRDNIASQLAPTLEVFKQINFGASALQADLARLSPVIFNASFATSPGMQALAESLQSYKFDWAVSPELTESMRAIAATSVGINEATRQMFQSPAFTEALHNISAANFKLNNFAETYANIARPLAETLSAAYEGMKIMDDFDFSVLDDIDEEAFEEFLDEHPELVETYETIERTIVRKGLISKETFSRAGERFKSSRAAKHLLIAVIMFSASAALMFGVKSLPDDLEDDAVMYLGMVGFMYTAYAVHSTVKKSVAPPEVE